MKIQFAEYNNSKLCVFWDTNGSECSIQADKLKDEKEYLWLGVNVDPTGKRAFRMLLDKNQASLICEMMKQFLETGVVATKPEEMPESIRSTPQKQTV